MLKSMAGLRPADSRGRLFLRTLSSTGREPPLRLPMAPTTRKRYASQQA